MKDFIKEFKKDIIFYGTDHYSACEKETNVDNIYRQETLICEHGKVLYDCMETRDDTTYRATGIVSNDVEHFLKLPISEIERICNKIYYYNLLEVEEWDIHK